MATKKKQQVPIDESGGEVTALSLPVQNPEKPKKSYVPEGFESVEDYLSDMRETYASDVEFDQDNRDAASDDKRFAAGYQWEEHVLRQREGLPCLTINTIPQFVAQLVGDWRLNKIGIKVLPGENGDQAVADVRGDIIRAIETNNRSTRVYNNAFESMVQCGDGAFRVGVQYAGDDAFDQEIVLQPIDDALSVVWDQLSIDPTGRDATHCFVDDMIPQKEFKKRWPDADPSVLNEKNRRLYTTEGWCDNKVVRATEHWRLIERQKMLVLFESGAIHVFEEDVDPTDVMAYVEKNGKPIRTRIAPCMYAQMHLVTGWKILAGPYEWKMTRLPIIRMAGRTVTVGDKRVRYGLVRFMKDSCRLKNFVRSVAIEQLGYAPKAKWIATEGAIEGREDTFRKAHLTRDPLLVVNDEAIIGQTIQRIDPPPVEAALLNEAQVNTQDMKDVTGIHDASLGIKSNETSGRAIQARQREGDVASLTYYDHGNAAVLEAGDVINQFIPQIYDSTRIIRTIGADEAAKLVTINDENDPNSPNIAVGKYDVAITTGASYTTKRVEQAEAMMNAIQVWPQLMGVAGDLVVKAQDWPGAEELAERLIKTIPPELLSDKEKKERGDQPNFQAIMQQQAQMQQQFQQAVQQLQQLQQENLILKTKKDTEDKRLEIDEYKAETDRITAYAAMIKAGGEAEIRERENEAHAHEQAHEHAMDVVNLMKDSQQHQAELDHEAEQNAQDRQQAEQERQAKNRDVLTQLKIRQVSDRINEPE